MGEMITTPMLLLFCLGAAAGFGGGLGVARWHLARHSALLNESIRLRDARLYGREGLHEWGRRDAVAADRYNNTEGAA